MRKPRQYAVTIDQNGQISLPEGLAQRFGIAAGEHILLEEDDGRLILHRSVNVLERVYIEPTNACNLTCRTCVRNIWQEAPGWMSMESFNRICEGLQSIATHPAVFFGGFGEPLAHPNFIAMVEQARGLSVAVDLITNGILLEGEVAKKILRAGVRTVWISLDGITAGSYQDIRLGGYLEQVLDNLRAFQSLRENSRGNETQLGISFVAMRRNIDDLPGLLQLARDLRVKHINVTNLLAHTDEMRADRLYDQIQFDTRTLPEVELARLNLDENSHRVFRQLVKSGAHISIAGALSQPARRVCPFIEKASLSIRWDGEVSPCLGLLHSHESYLEDRVRRSHAYLVGNINSSRLGELWMQTDFVELRKRLQQFDYSPCVYCNSCEMSEQNLEDCFGNRQPACGGCLWAQGMITCP